MIVASLFSATALITTMTDRTSTCGLVDGCRSRPLDLERVERHIGGAGGRVDAAGAARDKLHVAANPLTAGQPQSEQADVLRLQIDGVAAAIEVIRAGRR